MAVEWKRVLATLLLGQLLSLLITGTGVTSTLLAEEAGASLPGTQSLLAYTLLALVYPAALLVRTHLRRRRRRRNAGAVQADGEDALAAGVRNGDADASADDVDDAENAPTVPAWFRRAWWQYAVVALIDVEANYVVVLAYQYTSITSIMLLDCFAIPVVMLLSRWRFAQRFSRIQLAGVALSLVGVALLVTSDVLNGRNDPNTPNPALGDVLCLVGATMYAICNVWQEELVKKHGQLEFVALLSLFAVPISLVQSGALEGKLWATVNWSGEVIGLFIGFALCLFCVYSLVPVFLAVAGATPLNLSLLSSDFYALLFGIILFDFEIYGLYVVAFVAVVIGVILYERYPPPPPPPPSSPSSEDAPAPDSAGDDRRKQDAERTPLLAPADTDTSVAAAPRLTIGTGLN